MNFDKFIDLVPKIRNLSLPGQEAQFLMAPIERVKELSTTAIEKKNPKQAGVMALLYPYRGKETYLVLILRKTYKGVHSNQVGFPGGKVEPEDAHLEATALRETEEEIGVNRKDIAVVKQMTNIYIPPSNFWVQSFIGYTQHHPQFTPQPSEVEAIIEVPLQEFLSDTSHIETTLSTSYATDITVPAFDLQGHVVWGATAMMLSEMKQLFKKLV
ncbi:MAG: CoA pyrophosphatase [Dokdonia sp.]|jgi:8-oxo-dGTP pyrophosphatase MutT (NUDIX family)|nr:coenzyme A pyrophosphatase [Cytophagaceae bacterium]|tara:strand:+ start:41 stop:682 length:642 start_codon:yes stop_codon:yes gene_type:complete